jgi:hypothetical protein
MNDSPAKESSLVDTTDCLEGIGVFRGMKNVFFVISIVCLLLLQVSFWLVRFDLVKTGNEPSAAAAAEKEKIIKAAEKVAADPNQLITAMPEPQTSSFFEFERLASLIRFFNFVLIPAAILYCLTMLFSLKVSLLGRLGGINHIARAFFLSLAFAVFLMPWQKLFPGVFLGAMYTPAELQSACAEAENYNIFALTLHYLRFTGYWLAVVLLLVFAQLRSGRWSKAILRRLEVI